MTVGLSPRRCGRALDGGNLVHGDSNNHAKALEGIESGAHLKKSLHKYLWIAPKDSAMV